MSIMTSGTLRGVTTHGDVPTNTITKAQEGHEAAVAVAKAAPKPATATATAVAKPATATATAVAKPATATAVAAKPAVATATAVAKPATATAVAKPATATAVAKAAPPAADAAARPTAVSAAHAGLAAARVAEPIGRHLQSLGPPMPKPKEPIFTAQSKDPAEQKRNLEAHAAALKVYAEQLAVYKANQPAYRRGRDNAIRRDSEERKKQRRMAEELPLAPQPLHALPQQVAALPVAALPVAALPVAALPVVACAGGATAAPGGGRVVLLRGAPAASCTIATRVQGESPPPNPPPARVAVNSVVEVKEAEGYKLFLSSDSATGYQYVTKSLNGRRFVARCLGTYDTAVEAALAYAKHMAAHGVYADESVLYVASAHPDPAPVAAAAADAPAGGAGRSPETLSQPSQPRTWNSIAPVKEAEGYKLHLSSRSATGYLGVYWNTSADRFIAHLQAAARWLLRYGG